MKYFDKKHIYFGNLESYGKSIGECRCEINTYEIFPESWYATISAFQGSSSDLPAIMKHESNFRFITSNGQGTIIISGMLPSLSFSSSHDEIVKFQIKDYYQEIIRTSKPSSKLQISYNLPDVEIYKCINGFSKHYKKGYLRGWEGWKNEDLAESDSKVNEWIDDIYFVPSDLGIIGFSEILEFSDSTIENKDVTIVFKQMTIQCKIENIQDPMDIILKKIENIIGDYLTILSFIERDRIEWYYCCIYSENREERMYDETLKYRKSIIRKAPTFSDHFLSNRTKLQKSHIELTKLFSALSETGKGQIEKIISRFLIANRIEAIDTQVIYWHSCLDVLIKEFDVNGRSFNHKLVNACKKSGIEWLDLYPDMTEENISLKKEFPINKIRNEMLHDGEYPENYQLVFSDIPKVRALCERFITKLIGFDYHNSGLGNPGRH